MKEYKLPINILLFIGLVIVLISFGYNFDKSDAGDNLESLKVKYSEKLSIPVNHQELEILQGEFETPQEVTRACISCHTERHKEVMETAHWKWEREEFIPGRGIVSIGKNNLLNNFCIGIGGSEQACNRCHPGYGYSDSSFDFSKSENIDCLVCHDNSATYTKAVNGAGCPDKDVDLAYVARNVGKPKRDNCGTCHFYSGGGNNVKHGDLEEALLDAPRNVDVHMGIDGMDMDCIACHGDDNHNIKGKLYSVSSMNTNRLACEECHGATPHSSKIVNEHTLKVACQTCHIPIYAKENATKMTWDWSTAGELRDGEPFHEEDADGNHTYLSIKGSFTWEKNVIPEYQWFNGTADHYLIGDKIDTALVVPMNTLFGSYEDPEAKIIPVKVHRARQIFDCDSKTIIQPKLYAAKKGEGAYWKDFDWDAAAHEGMKAIHGAYSGNYCFIETEMTWPINHMVSVTEETVACNECHTRDDSRLAGLTGFYLPGRDNFSVLEYFGKSILILSFIGVLFHGIMRAALNVKRKRLGK